MMKGEMTIKTLLGVWISLSVITACESWRMDLDTPRTSATAGGQAADSIIFEDDEQKASFPGGQEALLEFLDRNVKYPANYDGCAQGRVVVSFTVNTDGSITQPKVIRSVDKELDDEALRVVGLMPKWIPTKVKGKSKKSTFILPILIKTQ